MAIQMHTLLDKTPVKSANSDSAGLPVQTKTLIEKTYIQLRDDIVDGQFTPGEKLRIQHLDKIYGVASGTLREAITRLVSEFLVVAEGQRGFRVAPATLSDLEDLTNLRVDLEIQALRRSIRHGTAEWRQRVTNAFNALSEMEQPLDLSKTKRWEALNQHFHNVLIEGCNSPWTVKLLEVLSRHSERYRRFSIGLQSNTRNVHTEHQEIFDYAMSGNELRAALALESHIRTTLDLLKHAQAQGVDIFASNHPSNKRHVR